MKTEIAIEDPPRRAPNWIERRAKLFEAGEYPDKGVSIGIDDLNRLTASFGEPVPVLIEHAHSPLELGYLTAVEAIGHELFGTVSLTEEANSLVERSGAKSLSLGLSPDLARICEVSLVRNPRVATAQLYSDGPRFESELIGEAPSPDWRLKFYQLEQARRTEEAERKIETLVGQGRLVPAQVPFARAILASEGTVQFDGATVSLPQALLAIIERNPPHTMFGERAPDPVTDHSRHLMLPEEVAFYQQHFPGVSLDEIAKARPR